MDALLDEQRAEADPEARLEIWNKMWNIIHDQVWNFWWPEVADAHGVPQLRAQLPSARHHGHVGLLQQRHASLRLARRGPQDAGPVVVRARANECNNTLEGPSKLPQASTARRSRVVEGIACILFIAPPCEKGTNAAAGPGDRCRSSQ